MATQDDVRSEDRLEPPGMRASRLRLERASISEVWCDWRRRNEPYGASEGEIEHSKAISLKRIADALEAANALARAHLPTTEDDNG